MRFHVLAVAALVFVGSMPVMAEEKPKYPTLGTIERKDPRFDEIAPQDARVERLAEGFDWAEGPVWVKDGEYLLFSDIPPNKVMKWKEGDGVSLFLHPSGYTGDKKDYSPEPGSNGLIHDAAGNLVLCQHGDRRLAKLGKNKQFKTLVDKYQGKRLNSPNDAVLKSNGDIYFTDPPYGLPNRYDSPERELDFCGVYRLSKDGELTLLTTEMTRPNGIGFSPDEKTLYVAQSDPAAAIWKAFPVKEDGTLGKSRLLFDATPWVKEGRPGLPDGLKVDQKGRIFATGPGGVHVFLPDGTLLGTFNTGQKTANCGWGDDGSTLYITVDMYLGRVKLNTKGLGF
jgi:gluconolactonase